MEKFKKRGERGITLIALVIMIIVLLILAGVTIAALSGDNGILTRAADSKEKTEIADIKEELQRKILEEQIVNDGDLTETALETILTSKGTLSDEANILDRTLTTTKGNYEILVRDIWNGTLSGSSSGGTGGGGVGTEEPVEAPETGGATFTRANGTIDIQFLTGTTYTVGTANKPAIDTENMVPVNWDATNSCWVVTDETDWDYSYGDTDATKKWANVMLRDVLVVDGIADAKTATIADMKGKAVTTEGSMLVWLPRYAYKITYYAESDTNKTGSPVGYSDARGLVDADGKTPEGMNAPVTSIAVGDNYRPHPAFESSTTYTQGEWSTKLTGIWMGKFETTPKVNNKITIRPNTASYKNQKIGTFYTDAQDLGIANSHMAKNSEWGAMAYLTESKYGRNGTAVTQNATNTTTGQGAYITNINQSTTNNVYGIYDTVGGAWEYTVGYVADSSKNYGNSFASTDNTKNNKTESTQYATVYTKATSNSLTDNYNANINKVFGDGIIETSTAGSVTTSWHSAGFKFVGLSNSGYYCPFFGRGGGYGSTIAGSFCFSSGSGTYYSDHGFRVCLCVM